MKEVIFSTLILLVLRTPYSVAQSDEFDKKLITEKYQKGELDIYKFQRYAKEWRHMIQTTGYPELPFTKDSSDIYFGYVTEFDELNKKIIYSRVEEWLSLHYDNIETMIDYKDSSMGKIILKNAITVTPLKFNPKSNPTKVDYESINRFTVSGNKLRTEVFQINIVYYFGGNQNPEYFSDPYTRTNSIVSFYPLSKHEPEDWLGISYILQWTKSDIEKMVTSLTDFVADYENDYNF